MRIAGLAYEIGTKVVTNDDILELITKGSSHLPEKDLKTIIGHIKLYFGISGIKSRHWNGEEQTPLNMLLRAIDRALTQTGNDKNGIDYIIHCGVLRGFAEPGQAHIIAQAMGLSDVQCFDLVDACNSWIQSLLISYNMLKTGAAKRILVVNTECGMIERAVPDNPSFNLNSVHEVPYNFATLTLGEGVTATILEQGENQWCFKARSFKNKADLCTLPHINYELYSPPSKYIGVNGTNFTSFAKELNEAGKEPASQALTDLKTSFSLFKWIFPHGHAKDIWEKLLIKLGGDPKKLKWNTFENYGNMVSASIPVSIGMALDSGDLQRGDRIALWMGSAGLTFSAVDCIF